MLKHSSFRSNPYFEQYVNLLIRLHNAMRNGNEAESEDLREQMDLPGIHLKSKEIQWVKGLSADLYMLDDDEDFRPLDRPESQLMLDLKTASDNLDGETMLLLLRQAYFTKQEHRAWFRSRAYEMLGYFSLSQTFLAFAADKAPDKFEYRYMLLARFIGQEDFANVRVLASEYASESNQPPMLKILIAVALYRSTETLPKDQAASFLRQAVEVVKSASTQGLSPTDVLMKWMILAACYYRLGDITEAIAADTEAVNFAPLNANALEVRGRHRLRFDYNGAVEDFQAAIKLNTVLPYPYLFVIREYLDREDYEAARAMCSYLIARTTDRRVQAQSYEFLAIAMYGLGKSFWDVQNAYATALKMAPSERRRQNFQNLTVASMGVISRPHILFPLLSIEEIEAIENDVEAEELETGIRPAEKDSTLIGMSLLGTDMLSSYLNEARQQQVTDTFFKDSFPLAA